MPFTSYNTGLPTLGPLKVGLTENIPESSSVKYLGIFIDRHMRWDVHAKQLVQEVRGFLPKFRYLRDFLNIQCIKTLYFSLVQSILVYGIVGWGGIYDCYLNNINVVQKWILRIIYKKNILYHSNTLYEETGIFDLRQLYYLKIVLFIKQLKIKLLNSNYHYNTRRLDAIFFPRCNKTIGQRSANYLAPRMYTILPQNIKEISAYNTFRKKLQNWICEQNRYLFSDIINN